MKNLHLHIFVTFCLIVLSTSLVATVQADEATENKPTLSDENRARLDDLISRLNITEQQKADIRPILEKAAQDRAKILKDAGIERGKGARSERGKRPGFREMRKVRQPLQDARKRTSEELAKILTEEQMAELRKITEEMKGKRRNRRRG